MDSLRIHFLTNSIKEAGTYFRFHNLAVGLVKLGQQVTVFSCDPESYSSHREELRDGVLYRIVPSFRGKTYFSDASHPLNALRRCFVDYPVCDIAHLFQPFLAPAFSWQWVLPQKAKALFYDWDDLWSDGGLLRKPQSFREYWISFWISYIERTFPKKANHVTTCSQFLANLAKQRNAKRVSIIHNGFWSFTIPDKKLARESLGLDPQALYLGYMGTESQEIPWCLQALEMNLAQNENLRLALCGSEFRSLKKLSPKVLQRVDFLGLLPPKQTRNFAAALDLGLLPLVDNPFNQSRFPIKYAEYMAAGTPVLCSDIGECARISNDFSWVIKSGKTREQWLEGFEEAVNLITNDQLPQVSLSTLKDILSWHSISKNLLEIYISELNRA